ncbi:shikimate kinase AroK [Buchnera aphidicola]|uniref:shikimate kinase AroK n=1 Tax=Buchnera aphidicola TaxID=9 RepID=UPI00094D806C|nr:shikimate kinase AroK [Buchnera aphidicola]
MFEKNIFLIGPMGSGKSTVGRQLAQFLKMDFYDSDQEIEKRTGANIAWVFDIEGESGFRRREKKVISDLTKKNKIVLSTGGGSIISLSSRNFLITRGIIIYLKTTVEKQLLRTKLDKNRPLLTNLYQSDKYILEKLANERNPIYQSISEITINTDHDNVKTIVYKILKILRLKYDIKDIF